MRTNTFQTRETTLRDHGRKLHLTVKFGMSHLGGNPLPYFSITGETRRMWRGRPSKVESCGCLHDVIAKAMPSLRPLIKWHLADQDGLPMHYKANALYWRDCLLGKYERRSYDPDPIATFASHVLYGTVEGDDEMSVEDRMCSDGLADWLDSRVDALREAFEADMAAFDVPLMVNVGEGGWRALTREQAEDRCLRSQDSTLTVTEVTT